MGLLAARSAKVPDPPFRWKRVRGPWFDNNLAVLEDRGRQGLGMSWFTGVVEGGDHQHPRLEKVASTVVAPGQPAHRNRLGGPVMNRAINRVSWSVERRRRRRAARSPRPR
jgi:hypothetical protein